MAGYASGNGSAAQAPPGYVWDPVNKYYKAAPTAAAATNPTTHSSTITGPNGQSFNQQVPYSAAELAAQQSQANATNNAATMAGQNTAKTTSAAQAAQTAAAHNAMYAIDPQGQASYTSIAPGQSMADQTALLNLGGQLRSQATSQAGDIASGAASQAGQIASGAATQAGQIASGALDQSARLQAEAEARRMSMFSGLMSAQPQVSAQMGGDETAARDAAFARAKDMTGQTLRAGSDSLRNLYAGTGNVGGYEQGLSRLMSGGVGQLGDVTREQLIQDLNRSSAIGDRNYQGGITQRGQDMALLPSIMGLVTSRGLY